VEEVTDVIADSFRIVILVLKIVQQLSAPLEIEVLVHVRASCFRPHALWGCRKAP
jgi:hypothetical protein